MVEMVVLSSWESRFWAWLIDVLLMSILWHRALVVLKIDAFGLEGFSCWRLYCSFIGPH